MAVIFPSGSFMILMTFAKVPMMYRSFSVGFSSFGFFWQMIPINLFSFCASSSNFLDFSLPAVIGVTTDGNITIFLTGRIGKRS